MLNAKCMNYFNSSVLGGSRLTATLARTQYNGEPMYSEETIMYILGCSRDVEFKSVILYIMGEASNESQLFCMFGRVSSTPEVLLIFLSSVSDGTAI